MVEEIINSIIEAENKAEEIKKHAVTEARALVAKEEQKNENERKLAENECKKRYKESMQKFSDIAEESAAVTLKDGDAQAEIIEKEAEKNVGKAAEKILQELFN